MARHPEWFERLDANTEVVRQSGRLEWIGRQEMKAIFCCSERDSIRLLHKFGGEERDNALSLPRSALLAQLEAIRSGSTYAAFLRQRQICRNTANPRGVSLCEPLMRHTKSGSGAVGMAHSAISRSQHCSSQDKRAFSRSCSRKISESSLR